MLLFLRPARQLTLKRHDRIAAVIMYSFLVNIYASEAITIPVAIEIYNRRRMAYFEWLK
jgi:hypothetical protein